MKLQVKNILKIVFSIILMATVVFAFDKPFVAQAAGLTVSGDSCNITDTGSVIMTKTLTNDGKWYSSSCTTNYYEITFTNHSSQEKAVVINVTINGDFSSGYKPEPRYSMTLVNTEKCTGRLSFTIQPGQTIKSERIKFINSHKGSFNIVANVAVTNIYEASTDSNKPEVLTPGKEEKGNGSITGAHYYSLTLNEDSAVKVSFTGEAAEGLRYGEDAISQKDYVGKILYLKKGTYLFKAFCGTDGSKEYTLKCDVEAYNYGSVKVDWEGNTNQVLTRLSRKYKVTYTPGTNFGVANGSSLILVGEHLNDAERVNATTYEGSTDPNLAPGYKTIPYIVSSPISDKQFHIEYIVLPARPGKATYITGTHKLLNITYAADEKCGKDFVIECYKNGKWVAVKKISRNGATLLKFKVTKLKSNKTYKFRIYGIVPGENGKPALYSPVSPVSSVRTAPSQKPSIKSIRVSNIKVKKHKKVWHPGNWSGGRWFKGYWTGGHYSTDYTLKITLKKKVKGANGMVVLDKHKKGKGKTFTIKTGDLGKKIGKKKTLRIRMCTTNPNIVGPTVTKKITIR